MIKKIVVINLFFGLLTFYAQAQSNTRLSVPADVSTWITSAFAKGKTPPLSFVYDGKASASFLKNWNYSLQKERSDDSQIVRYTVTYVDPASGLKLDCHIKGFKDFKAVEWVLNFTNISRENSGVIEQVNVVDFTAQSRAEGDFTLYHAKGSDAKRSDFQPLETVLGSGEAIRMQPNGGRSSDDTGFPFFTLESPDHTGMVIGIGWSGNWFADIRQTGRKALNLKTGMVNMKLFLYPQETIRTPSTCILFWENEDRMEGQNQFRRFILTHHSRKIDGKFSEYPVSGGFNWGDPYPCNEYSCLTEDFACALINRYKQFGITPEVFWLDAGWYEGTGWYTNRGDWYTNVGNWTIDRERFPNGLKPLSDVAHKVGAKFMVWFEPERIYANTQFLTEHPEWVLKHPDDVNNFLFDLTNPEALRWFCKYFGDIIERNGIDYYRQDFNIRPEPFWKLKDEPGRIGMTEIRYIEGLYTYWDYLLNRFPNLLIDNCASGGRRLDLETVSRSAPLWRTDYQYGEPNGYQCHTYGLNFYLPLSGTGINKLDPYSLRSSLGSAVVLNWKLTNADVSILDMQKYVAEFKALRPYYYEDYYPLTGAGDLTGDDIWLAYQLNRPSDQSGIVVAFRRKDCRAETLTVKLRGLESEVTYTVVNADDQRSINKTGKELSEGITLEAPARGSVLLKYHKVKTGK
ncbi:MAG: alpha-galactosidase [Massilibacteroides sp.]|nr:alpha-galactosidase [Massilibacteroides sp.]